MEPTTEKLKLNSYKHVAYTFPSNPNYFAPCLFKDNLSYYIFKIDIQVKHYSFLSILLLHPEVWGLFCFCLDFGLFGFLIEKRQNHYYQVCLSKHSS